MIVQIKDFAETLVEEIKYYDNAVSYKKSLEATLWGLEQQAQYPQNSSKDDQDNLTDEINKCRIKVSSLTQLLKDQETKILERISSFNNGSKCSECSGL